MCRGSPWTPFGTPPLQPPVGRGRGRGRAADTDGSSEASALRPLRFLPANLHCFKPQRRARRVLAPWTACTASTPGNPSTAGSRSTRNGPLWTPAATPVRIRGRRTPQVQALTNFAERCGWRVPTRQGVEPRSHPTRAYSRRRRTVVNLQRLLQSRAAEPRSRRREFDRTRPDARGMSGLCDLGRAHDLEQELGVR